ncbi:MAG: response regulator [Desulfobacterales bacterium]|nr:response regulator [Desulfobacterales bacterium]
MGETLLLADDEEGIRRVLGIALADLGFRVLTAADGAEALETFRREKPAIVLTDIKMPGLNGIELLGRIKAERPDTEVIMITGHGDLELAIESLKLDLHRKSRKTRAQTGGPAGGGRTAGGDRPDRGGALHGVSRHGG